MIPPSAAPETGIDWTAALEQHRPWLRKVLSCRVGDRHTVEDLLQEIAVAVFGDSPKPTDDRAVAPWLYRLAIRQSINYHRRQNRKSAPVYVAELNPAAEEDPLHWLLAREKNAAMRSAIERLRAQDREILVLKYTENWSYRELADHLGTKTRTVEYRLARARDALRRELSRSLGQSSTVGQQAGWGGNLA